MDEHTFMQLMERLQQAWEQLDGPGKVRSWFAEFRQELDGPAWSVPDPGKGSKPGPEAEALAAAARAIERAGFWDRSSLALLRQAVIRIKNAGPAAAMAAFDRDTI